MPRRETNGTKPCVYGRGSGYQAIVSYRNGLARGCKWILRPTDIPEPILADELLIAIIDDDPPFRESMRRLMRSLGHAAAVFPSAADFLASPQFNQTACLIADVHMPEMTGLDLVRHLTQVGHPIPTILVTAYPADADRARALSDGVVCYLRKPVHEKELAPCLRTALGSVKPA